MNKIYPPGNLLLPAWTEGPTPYVYSRAPRGHRCAWACRYLVPGETVDFSEERGGQNVQLQRFVEVEPKDWHGVEPFDMDEAQILAELQDCLDRGEQAAEVYAAIRDIEERGIQATRIATSKLLRTLRQNYPIFVLPWQKPDPSRIRSVPPVEKPYRDIYDDALVRAVEERLRHEVKNDTPAKHSTRTR